MLITVPNWRWKEGPGFRLVLCNLLLNVRMAQGGTLCSEIEFCKKQLIPLLLGTEPSIDSRGPRILISPPDQKTTLMSSLMCHSWQCPVSCWVLVEAFGCMCMGGSSVIPYSISIFRSIVIIIMEEAKDLSSAVPYLRQWAVQYDLEEDTRISVMGNYGVVNCLRGYVSS